MGSLMWPEVMKWAATGFTMLAAVLTASNIGRRVTGWGFVCFSIGSACWLAAAQLEQETQLGLTNLVLLGINLVGVWRWLIRAPKRGEA